MTELAVGASIGADLALGEDAKLLITRKDWDRTARIITLPMSYSAPNPAFTYGYMSLGEVPYGKIWEVLRYSVVAAPDPTAALAGVSSWAFIVNGLVPQDSNTPPSVINDVLAVSGAVPNESYPGYHSVFLRQQDQLVIALKGLAALQQIIGSVGIIQYDMKTLLESLK